MRRRYMETFYPTRPDVQRCAAWHLYNYHLLRVARSIAMPEWAFDRESRMLADAEAGLLRLRTGVEP